MKLRFNIGDKVFVASCSNSPKSIVCPDCLGEGRLLVTMGDKTTHSIECTGCASGYEPPTGNVTIYENQALVEQATIDRLEIEPERIRYQADYHIYDDDRVFDNREDAEKRASELKNELNRQEAERIKRKHKDTRSWAWNATYHRRCIRQAEKDLIYHKAKLEVANLKVKTEITPKGA